MHEDAAVVFVLMVVIDEGTDVIPVVKVTFVLEGWEVVDDGLVVEPEDAELVVEEIAVVVDPVEPLEAFVVLDTVVGTE